jgi:hypothetical protein
MKEKLLTKSEAELARMESSKKQLDLFCPIARQTCRADCICYYQPQIYASTDKAQMFWVRDAYCNNPAITGEVTVHNEY